jgi:hypothetical protein
MHLQSSKTAYFAKLFTWSEMVLLEQFTYEFFKLLRQFKWIHDIAVLCVIRYEQEIVSRCY